MRTWASLRRNLFLTVSEGKCEKAPGRKLCSHLSIWVRYPNDSGSVYEMIEIDTKEFRGDRDRLFKFLRDKYKGPMQVQRNSIRLGDIEKSEAELGLQDAKDLVKRALHHIGMGEYRVVAHAGVVAIRERRSREPHAKRAGGSVPSVRESVPYFFPG